MTKSDITWQK